MMGVTIEGLLGRKVGDLLTALAVVLGIAMVSGTFVLTDTFQKAFNNIFTESYAGTDAVVSGKQPSTSHRVAVRRFQPASWTRSGRCRTSRRPPARSPTSIQLQTRSSSTQTARRSAARAARPPSASGSDSSELRILALSLPRGRGRAAPTRWSSTRTRRARRATRLETRSAWPPSGRSSVRDHGHREVRVESTRSVVRRLPSSTYRLRRASSARRASSTRSRLRRRKARRRSSSCRRWRRSCETAEVKTGAAQASADAKTTNDDIAFITYFLLGFRRRALRRRVRDLQHAVDHRRAAHAEFATVRTLGGSRRQVLGSVVIEGFVIGLLASVVGLFLGLGVGKGLNALFVALGIDLPQAGTVFATRTVVVSLLVGTTVTVLASIVPALRATRVPAISAVREGSILPPSASRRTHPTSLSRRSRSQSSLGLGLFVSGLQTPVLLLLLGFGAIALFLGVALLAASRLVKPSPRRSSAGRRCASGACRAARPRTPSGTRAGRRPPPRRS